MVLFTCLTFKIHIENNILEVIQNMHINSRDFDTYLVKFKLAKMCR